MDPARWEAVQQIFHDALAQPASERASYLELACRGDESLLADVRALIAADASPVTILEAGVHDVAQAVLDERDTLTSIGPYRLVSILGEGGMGTVHRAERDDVNSVVAIKLLRHAWMSLARRERFMAERRILAQLNHPAIARLYDADVLADGTPWFAMEYVEGQSLTAYCDGSAPTLVERLKLFRKVCEAVQHAHGHLVIHRDLKPSNILVRSDGQLKLLDFGISKQLDESGAPDPTMTSLRLMTPAYAAPEQIRGARTGVYTDIYTLGVILYELVTRRRPFDLSQRTPADAEAIILDADPVRPSLVAGRLPASRASWADLNVLCLTAMRKEPERRYPTVEAMIRDIDHFLAGEPLEARPDSLAYRGGKFVRRHWRSLTIAAAAVPMLLGLAGYYAMNLAAARNTAEAEAARTRRIQGFMLNLFEGDGTAGPANDLRVVTLIERGIQGAHALDREPAAQADLYQTLGGISQRLGNYPQAESLLSATIERRRALFGENHPATAASLIELGLLRLELAKLDEAEALVRRGLDITSASGSPLEVARATAALGQVLEARGAYTDAIAVNEEAMRLFTLAGDADAGLTAAMSQLADSHYYAGHYEVADEINGRVLQANIRIYGEHHPKVADVLINLGASQTDRGRYADAEPYYRRALAVLTAYYGKEHFRVASAMTMLGRTLVYQKKFTEAVPLLERALAIHERVSGTEHPRVASVVNDLGSAALQQDRFDDAEAYFRRMLAIYGVVYKQEHYLHGIATSNLASVLSAKGRYADAEALFRRAVGIYSRTQGPEHLNTGISRVKLGRTLVRQRRFQEAERELLDGLAILQAQASPSVSWTKSARADLVSVYEALREPEKAARYRAGS